MTAIWMGHETVAGAVRSGALLLTGERGLADSMERWLGLSPFARTAPAATPQATVSVPGRFSC